ncbi:hypothetical protein ACHAXA_004563 [Cyclostephanos tholiformis]|uniref:SUN domain-containing protein n=1 Tax=Cyclostephanos tholiformis TaxID=382380 RepID=A0ABD3RDH5_9STRA
MAKTPPKPKANAVVAFEEKEDFNEDDGDEDDGEAFFPNKDATPARASLVTKKMTPGSSGESGMRMRSGRKKRRPKPRSEDNDEVENMPPRKRTREGGGGGGKDDGAAAAAEEEEGEEHDDDVEMTTNGEKDEEKRADDLERMEEDEEDAEEGEGVASLSSSSAPPPPPRSRATTATATVSKVPPETTREAIAAAQVADESPYDEDDDDDEGVGDEIGGGVGDSDDAAASSNIDGDNDAFVVGEVGGRENPISRLFFQTLRLPSQLGATGAEVGRGETPSSVSPPPLPPPGGRRLIFSTVRKGGGTGAFGGYDAGRGGDGIGGVRVRNGLLAQTRVGAVTSTTSTRRGTGGEGEGGGALSAAPCDVREVGASASNAGALAGRPLFLRSNLIEEEEEEGAASYPFAADLLRYVGRWYLLLVMLLVLGNVIAMSLGNQSICGKALGIVKANVGEWGNEWGNRYDIVPEANAADDDDHASSPMSPPEIIIKREPDPAMLAEARAAMITRRAKLQKIKRLEQSVTAYRDGLELLDVAVQGWTTSYPDMKKEVVKRNENESASSDISYKIFDEIRSSVSEERSLLLDWESALMSAEEALDLLDQGKIGSWETNAKLSVLSEVSKVPLNAMVLDATKIIVPGEDCEGMDYVPLKRVDKVGDEEEVIKVGRGINVDALDPASDAPILFEDAQKVYEDLLELVKSQNDLSPMNDSLPFDGKQMVQEIIDEELQKKGLDKDPPSIDELHAPVVTKIDTPPPSSYTNDEVYTARDAVIDIDRALEREDADRTGMFDYASINHGARVLRRGPFATSYSLYETLPLLNRVLAYSKLRFYGHPPEVALRPTFPINARGQCWSFPNESSTALSRRRVGVANDLIGWYGTLSVTLASAITVTEVIVEHVAPAISHDPTSAIREFRVLGFEDGGAFGEPWELGSFTFAIGPSIQAFPIPTTMDGQNVPRMKAISLAVDSNEEIVTTRGGSHL